MLNHVVSPCKGLIQICLAAEAMRWLPESNYMGGGRVIWLMGHRLSCKSIPEMELAEVVADVT